MAKTYLRQQLIQLHHGNVLAHASSRAGSERQLGGLELKRSLLAHHPPLGLEIGCILPVERPIPLYDVCVAGDIDAARNEIPVNDFAALGHDPCQDLRGGGQNPESFFDTSSHEGKL